MNFSKRKTPSKTVTKGARVSKKRKTIAEDPNVTEPEGHPGGD